MLLARQLDLTQLIEKKSFFLFGSRAVGKSTLLKQQFDDSIPCFNLLRSELYLRLMEKPFDLESMILSHGKPDIVIIDEVQRIPILLNEVHRLIEDEKIRFILTGSSARSLRRHHVNLLAGRAWEANLFPLTFAEIPDFNLNHYLRFGGLPAVYLSESPDEELRAYTNTYLKEEIQAEAIVRRISAFSRFLQVAALTSGQILNFSSLSSDTGIPVSTVREYYKILEDTFIGFLVPAWTKTIKRKPKNTAKFYYFDIGVRNQLAGITTLPIQSDLYGQAFEHFIALELRAYLSYRRHHLPIQYWQSKHHIEVDFIIGDDLAIEVKTTNKVSDKHFRGLKLLAEENICQRYILISHDSISRKVGNIEIMPWQTFLKNLWDDKIVTS